MTWDRFWTWVSSFDVVKAVILSIVVMVGSWYDLRAEVRGIVKDLAVHEKQDEKTFLKQEVLDANQDQRTAAALAAHEARMAVQTREIQDTLKDIQTELRSQRRR